MSKDIHPVLKVALAIMLLILTVIVMYGINVVVGAYLTWLWWLGIFCVIGIFDIYAYVKVTH